MNEPKNGHRIWKGPKGLPMIVLSVESRTQDLLVCNLPSRAAHLSLWGPEFLGA